MKRFFIPIITFLILFSVLNGCGGTATERQSGSLTGVTQKGDFLKDSQISFARFTKQGASSTERLDGVIKNQKGEYAVSLSWKDWTKTSVTGSFFNEVSGLESTIALTLNSITDVGASSGVLNVNLFTHLVSARIEHLIDAGESVSSANTRAISDIKSLLGLSSTTNIYKLNLAENNNPDNAVLLLLSSGFLATTKDKNKLSLSLDQLTVDFANNGLIDGSAKQLFQNISNYAGKKDVFTALYNNLLARGYKNPPTKATLSQLPEWVNINPIANIEGANTGKIITEGESLTLRGSGTDSDGTISEYLWTEGAVNKGSENLLELTGLTVGEHFFKLTVTDNEGASSTALIKVTVNAASNKAPVANAGEDKAITFGQDVTLSGSGKDSDGTIVSWSWKVGNVVKKSGNNGIVSPLTLKNLSVGEHFLKLSVTDDDDATGTDIVKVTVNPLVNKPPVANAGADKAITFGQDVTLSGSGEDSDGTIVSWTWKEGSVLKNSGSNGTIPPLVLNNLSVGEHVLTLSVTDDDDATDTDIVNVTVSPTSVNKPPVANAGLDKAITFGQEVTLSGSGEDSDGTIVSWTWKKGSVLKNSGSNGTIPPLVLNNLSVGEHVLTLSVTDDDSATDTDTVKVTVSPTGSNKPPIANAGANKTIVELQVTKLTGTGTDSDGSIVSYEWKEGTNTLSTTSQLELKTLTPGTHNLTLIVTDNESATGNDSVVVTVKPLSVNLTNQVTCVSRTFFGRLFHIEAIYTLTGNRKGGGQVELNQYSVAGCTGVRSDVPVLARFAPATYVITQVASSGRSGKMSISSQGRSSTRPITIGINGNVTEVK